MIKRRRRKKYIDWPTEIIKGHINEFYKSTDWDIARENALARDKHTCQFFLGKYKDEEHLPKKIQIKTASTVHHIIPLKERPDLCLDLNNLVSLSREAHEIIEDRYKFYFKSKKEKPLTEEKW